MGSELTLIPGDSHYHRDPLDGVGASGGYVVNGVLAKPCLIVGPMDLKIYPGVILLFFQCIIGIYVQNYHLNKKKTKQDNDQLNSLADEGWITPPFKQRRSAKVLAGGERKPQWMPKG